MIYRKLSFSIIFFLAFICELHAQSNEIAGIVKDIEGNVYKTVVIGKQIWMSENLKTTRFNNGDTIGTTQPDTLNFMKEINPKYQWIYAGNDSNLIIYGRLYTWYVVTDSRNVCPIGWQVPAQKEWATLIGFLGEDSIAHGKLKDTGTKQWKNPNIGATNESGFTGIPGGNHHPKGTFLFIGECGHWRSVTEFDNNYACRLRLRHDTNIENFLDYAPKLMG
jgi:uncharacterized protein (TIGR02145 family)